MSFQAKRELLVQTAPRYQAASPAQKSIILNEVVAATGYDRKYAIRLLTNPVTPPAPIKRTRKPRYGPAVQEALRVAWAASNGICAKRLVPFLPELVPILERHGHLSLTKAVCEQLPALSPATADRLLRPIREATQPHGIGTTKRGSLLKHQLPVRTFAGWNETQSGFKGAILVSLEMYNCARYNGECKSGVRVAGWRLTMPGLMRSCWRSEVGCDRCA